MERRERAKTPPRSTKCILLKTWGVRNSSNPVYSYVLAGIALLVLFIACGQLYHPDPRTASNPGARSRLAKSRWRKTHCKSQTNLSANRSYSSPSRVSLALPSQKLALPTFNNLAWKIPILERRPQSYNARLSHSSRQPRRHHSRGVSRLCAIPPATNPES